MMIQLLVTSKVGLVIRRSNFCIDDPKLCVILMYAVVDISLFLALVLKNVFDLGTIHWIMGNVQSLLFVLFNDTWSYLVRTSSWLHVSMLTHTYSNKPTEKWPSAITRPITCFANVSVAWCLIWLEICKH